MNGPQPNFNAGQLTLRQPLRSDGSALHALIANCPPLDLNSVYAYLLLCLHHPQTSVVAELDGILVGTVTAYIPPQQPDTLFVWQVAVAPQMRGQKLAPRMLQHLVQACITPRQLRWMETTISPSNRPSHQLFTNFSLQHDAGCSITPLFAAEDFGESGHEEERLYKLGPWDRAA
ncbi:MAG: L-2,4-diaminobutyric acid acetyltransferase [Rhodoferax sp.]|jgi:L-2,4-diaminobutyric acid acetyltransferase